MIDKSNHGNVGKALYLKYTAKNLPFRVIGKEFKHGDVLSVEYLNRLSGLIAGIPIHIDDSTQGEYECVCEFGTEIH